MKDGVKFCGFLSIAGLWKGISIPWRELCTGMKHCCVLKPG